MMDKPIAKYHAEQAQAFIKGVRDEYQNNLEEAIGHIANLLTALEFAENRIAELEANYQAILLDYDNGIKGAVTSALTKAAGMVKKYEERIGEYSEGQGDMNLVALDLHNIADRIEKGRDERDE
jgi:hypothetical protein